MKKDVGSYDSTQGCTVSLTHTARPEESGSEALGEPAQIEDEPRVPSEHQKHLGAQGATAESEDLASSLGPTCGPLKESEVSKTSLKDQGNQNRSIVAQDPPEVMKEKEKEGEKEGENLTSKTAGLVDEDKGNPEGGDITEQTQETFRSSPKCSAQLEVPSDKEPGTASKIYFETSSKGHEEESYYELGTKGEELHGETDCISGKVDDLPDKRARAQRSLSLNITVGSTAGHTSGANPKAFSEGLPPLPGSFDDSETLSLTIQHQGLPAVSITPTSTEISEDTSTNLETPLLSDMLDLAGALPRPSLEKRDLDHLRRKSMPSNVSGLSASSLASLVLSDDALKLGGENQLEELGYCVFSEYSGPMPSPADVAPSPIDCLHQRFPSIESEPEGELGTKEVDQKLQHEGTTADSSQKLIIEKKDSPVKSSLILEKAVPVGVKPDRLRIPSTSSKDRLTEFRLEIGLPGDLKIQAIPEVDIEKDPSRETSPIPPDSSFTFSETGSKAPPTPTTPKSPNDSVPEVTVAKTKTDVLQEVKGCEGDKRGLDKEECKGSQVAPGSPANNKIQSEDTRIEAKATDDSNQETQIQNQKTPDIFSPKPITSTTVIIIPQAQVEEELDEDDVEIAEEPEEIMEDPALPQSKEGQIQEAEKVQVRLTVSESIREYDPKSGDDWSHSSHTGEDGEPATDSSHLSPYSDHDQSVEGSRGESTREKNPVEVVEITKDSRKDEVGDETEKWQSEDKVDKDLEIGEEMNETSDVLCLSGDNTDTTQDVSCIDTDSGWMDSQGTQHL